MCEANNETIYQYLTKGYVRQVDATKEYTFLAHFPVVTADKDTTKTKIAFVEKDKISVNNLILAGLKLKKGLFDVLIWFKRNAVAVVCEISEMFLQIKL